MDTKEGQLGIRDWIDQAFDNAALAVGKPVVLAAKRHDLVLDPQTGSPGHPIGLQPRARDSPAHATRRRAVQVRPPAPIVTLASVSWIRSTSTRYSIWPPASIITRPIASHTSL